MLVFKILLVIYAILNIFWGIIVRCNIGNSQILIKEFIYSSDYITNTLPINYFNRGFFLLILIWLALWN